MTNEGNSIVMQSLYHRRKMHALMSPADLVDRTILPAPSSHGRRRSATLPLSESSPVEAPAYSRVRVCRVETVLGDRFTALYSSPDRGDKRVRFSVDEIAESDRPLLREGAIFYWIGRRDYSSVGVPECTTSVRFRRMPRVSQAELEELDLLAQEAIAAGGADPITDDDLLEADDL